jgi:hypothetical protein
MAMKLEAGLPPQHAYDEAEIALAIFLRAPSYPRLLFFEYLFF